MKANKWVNIAETAKYPRVGETVWLYNEKDKCVWLGCLVYVINEGIFWAVSNGTIYAENGNMVSECEIDDDYKVTHWCSLPKLPK